jgi:hypothetical protein
MSAGHTSSDAPSRNLHDSAVAAAMHGSPSVGPTQRQGAGASAHSARRLQESEWVGSVIMDEDPDCPEQLDPYLAYYGQSRADHASLSRPTPPCPTPRYIVDRSWSERRPVRCRSLRCPACIRSQAMRTAAAIALAHPSQFLLLTRVGDAWPQIGPRVCRMRQALRRQGLVWQDAYHVERNPAGDGFHIHMWWWGDRVMQPQLEDAVKRVGMGEVCNVLRAYVPRHEGRPALLPYGLKEVLNPPLGARVLWPEAEGFLTHNGGRLVHSTRDFWRDAYGRRLPGVAAARLAAFRAHQGAIAA